MGDPGGKRAFWAGQVEAWRTSSLSQRAFAEARGLSYTALRRWVALLRGSSPPAEVRRDPSVPGAIPTDIPSAPAVLEMEGAAPVMDGLDLLPPPSRRGIPMRAEILSGPERRRRFTREQKLQLVAEAGREGQSVSLIARRYGIGSDLLFRWRRQFRAELGLVPPPSRRGEPAVPTLPPNLVPVRIAPEPAPPAGSRSAAPSAPEPERYAGLIEIELSGGHRLRVDCHVDADALRLVLAALQDGEARR